MEISKCLKEARVKENLTQEDLAEQLGVSRQTISSWENGKSYPDIASIIKISDIFHISLDKLLKEDKNLINKLQENTDTVKSNKAIVFTIILAIIIYAGIYLIRNYMEIPKIDNFFLNIMAILIFLIGTAIYIVSNINFGNFLNKKTSNKSIVKVIITIFMILAIVLIFPLLKNITNVEWIIFTIRISIILILSFICFIIFKKIDRY